VNGMKYLKQKVSLARGFPDPNLELETVLKYGQPTIQDFLEAASIVRAYHEIVLNITQADRNETCKELKARYKDRKKLLAGLKSIKGAL